MISIIQEIKVEVSKPNFFQAIVAKQYDSNSRFLKATLVQDNEKINVLSTSTVTINAKRNDGAEKSFTGEVNEDGTVTVPLTYWMLELNGTLECDISIFGADESKLTSTKFIVEVERASCSGGDVTDSDKCDILILQGQNIVGSVNGKTGVVELTAADVGAASNAELEEKTTEFTTALDNINLILSGTTDRVVESGTSDVWTYRKWASGIAECWCNTSISTYNDNRSLKLNITLPLSFTAISSVQVTDLGQTASEITQRQHNLSYEGFGNNQILLMAIFNGGGVTDGQSVKVSIDVKGRWK